MDRAAARTRTVRQIINSEPIATQQDMVVALRRRGISVTQATVSRDIKRLGLIKVPGGDGRYRYALPGVRPVSPAIALRRLQSMVEEWVTNVDTALDLILIKTEPGGASPVAEAIDDAQWSDVAGTLAGENTIIVVPRSRAAGPKVVQRLRRLMRGPGE